MKAGKLSATTVAVILLLSGIAKAEKEQWVLAGKIKNGDFLMYFDPSSITYPLKNYARFRVKEELSDEGLERFKKDNYAAVKEAEEKAGDIARGHEPLLKTLARFETKEYVAEIDCPGNEFRIPPKTQAGFNFVRVNPIEPNTAEEKIKNAVCAPPQPQ